MDFSTLSDDDFATAVKAVVDELHRRVDARPDDVVKDALQYRLAIAHKALDVLRARAASGGVIQPYSGGDPKP